ncbi:hypothetical protein A2714_00395 [Candidatus Woesebacteria bacterium RIFCSPHIGHO2_01_FULL_38_9]|uniref:Uncharacterized protein n=2 Tax=Candidatus Woeseibacteriota TaxID=1752722 RepID=A0A1F7Y2F7_9BACT|nr:MAG: hypothetical protein A2714_00395 [Candidatus Woesebacteria bacterium RIFCSPHIGHO2_01_FULL_38_9]OGM58296.1 MAG: hypothetical protein A3A75_04660 [Candidatus Woesebacteria bacterium RIFCSPLOWO2_01_FULL_39_10]
MTDIPGTGKPSFEVEKKKMGSITPMAVVNVNEMKKPKAEKPMPNDYLWYNQFKYWLFFGILFGAVFLLLALLNLRFLILAPLGPLVAVVSWKVSRIVRRYDEKTKNFFK